MSNGVDPGRRSVGKATTCSSASSSRSGWLSRTGSPKAVPPHVYEHVQKPSHLRRNERHVTFQAAGVTRDDGHENASSKYADVANDQPGRDDNQWHQLNAPDFTRSPSRSSDSGCYAGSCCPTVSVAPTEDSGYWGEFSMTRASSRSSSSVVEPHDPSISTHEEDLPPSSFVPWTNDAFLSPLALDESSQIPNEAAFDATLSAISNVDFAGGCTTSVVHYPVVGPYVQQQAFPLAAFTPTLPPYLPTMDLPGPWNDYTACSTWEHDVTKLRSNWHYPNSEHHPRSRVSQPHIDPSYPHVHEQEFPENHVLAHDTISGSVAKVAMPKPVDDCERQGAVDVSSLQQEAGIATQQPTEDTSHADIERVLRCLLAKQRALDPLGDSAFRPSHAYTSQITLQEMTANPDVYMLKSKSPKQDRDVQDIEQFESPSVNPSIAGATDGPNLYSGSGINAEETTRTTGMREEKTNVTPEIQPTVKNAGHYNTDGPASPTQRCQSDSEPKATSHHSQIQTWLCHQSLSELDGKGDGADEPAKTPASILASDYSSLITRNSQEAEPIVAQINRLLDRIDLSDWMDLSSSSCYDEIAASKLSNVLRALMDGNVVSIGRVKSSLELAAFRSGVDIDDNDFRYCLNSCGLGITDHADEELLGEVLHVICNTIREAGRSEAEIDGFLANLSTPAGHSAFSFSVSFDNNNSSQGSSYTTLSGGLRQHALQDQPVSPSNGHSVSTSSNQCAQSRKRGKPDDDDPNDRTPGPMKRLDTTVRDDESASCATEQIPCVAVECQGKDRYMSDLLRQLSLHHSLSICRICYGTFDSETERVTHMRSNTCSAHCVSPHCRPRSSMGRSADDIKARFHLFDQTVCRPPVKEDVWRFIYAMRNPSCQDIPELVCQQGAKLPHRSSSAPLNGRARGSMFELRQMLARARDENIALQQESQTVRAEKAMLEKKLEEFSFLLRLCLEQAGQAISNEVKKKIKRELDELNEKNPIGENASQAAQNAELYPTPNASAVGTVRRVAPMPTQSGPQMLPNTPSTMTGDRTLPRFSSQTALADVNMINNFNTDGFTMSETGSENYVLGDLFNGLNDPSNANSFSGMNTT